MAEVTEKAYQDLKRFIADNWTWIELRDSEGNRTLRTSIDNDAVNWIHPTKEVQVGWDSLGNRIYADVPDTQTLQLEIVVDGTYTGISLPATFAQSVIQNENGDDLSIEEFEPFTMTQEEDQITIVHNIEVPQL